MKNRLRFFVEKIGKGDESLKTKCALTVAAVVIFISCVIVIFYGYRKSGFFLDEIYSYGLSNSHYAPFLRDVKDGEIREKVFLRQELLDYVTVGKIKFDYKSVYYNQTRDVHPPFYYWILNMISSVFPFTFSKWIGIGVNLIFFVITLASLFFLTYKMFDDYRISGVVTVLYGTSKAAISTAVMIRMYMLMTMFTVLLTLCVYEIRESEKRRKILFPVLSILIAAGALTHYYFIIYAFFVCAVETVYVFCKKKYKYLLFFSISSLTGIVLMILIYPSCLTQIFKKTGTGQTFMDHLSDYGQILIKTISVLKVIFNEIYALSIIGLLLLFTVILKQILCFSRKRDIISFRNMGFIIPILLTFFTVLLISSPTDRYFFNLMPMFGLIVGLLLWAYKMAKDKQGNTVELPEWVALIMVLVMVSVVFMKPSYIYWENKERMSALSSCSSSPCVFITDNRNPSITSELQNLLLFDDIFVTDLESCDGVEKYIESHGANMKTVVFIATYPKKKNDENILNCISDIADYKEKQSLYQGDFANVYELYK